METLSQYFKNQTFIELMEEGSRQPPRRKIIGPFLRENTNTFFFSRSNYGKSLLAFAIAFCASTGTSLADCLALINECEPIKTLLLDMEMDAKTIFDRHGIAIANTDPELMKNLVYLHPRSSNKLLTGFALLEKIEQAALETESKLIIIDNISSIISDSLKAEFAASIIDMLNRVRERTGAQFLVIGHTTKGDIKTAVTETSYYGSSVLWNHFMEIFYLDMTKDARFFLAQSKSKQKECFTDTVPVFNRGDHPLFGVGFNFEMLMPLDQVQLPKIIMPEKPQRKINLADYRHEIALLDQAGIRHSRIASLCNVSRSSISRLFESGT